MLEGDQKAAKVDALIVKLWVYGLSIWNGGICNEIFGFAYGVYSV